MCVSWWAHTNMRVPVVRQREPMSLAERGKGQMREPCISECSALHLCYTPLGTEQRHSECPHCRKQRELERTAGDTRCAGAVLEHPSLHRNFFVLTFFNYNIYTNILHKNRKKMGLDLEVSSGSKDQKILLPIKQTLNSTKTSKQPF